jgi:hypothetical protein
MHYWLLTIPLLLLLTLFCTRCWQLGIIPVSIYVCMFQGVKCHEQSGTSMDSGRMQRMDEYYLDLLSNISTVCQKLADC